MIIGGLYTSISTSDINNDIQADIFDKIVDAASVTPELGQNIDISI